MSLDPLMSENPHEVFLALVVLYKLEPEPHADVRFSLTELIQ